MRQLKHIWRCWNDNEYYAYVAWYGHLIGTLFMYYNREYHKRYMKSFVTTFVTTDDFILPTGFERQRARQSQAVAMFEERRSAEFLAEQLRTRYPFPTHVQEQIKNKKARVRIRVKPKFLAGMTRECRKLQVQRLGLPWHAAKPARYGAKWYPLDGGYR